MAVGQDEPPRVEVERVTGLDRAEIRQGQQAGDVAVVDAVVVAVGVHLVRRRPSRTSGGSTTACSRSARSTSSASARHWAAVSWSRWICFQHLGRLAQADDGEEVRRHQEREDGRVVAGPEHGADQADRFGGMAIAAPGQGVGLDLGAALEAVGALAGLALLFAEGLERCAAIASRHVASKGAVSLVVFQ